MIFFAVTFFNGDVGILTQTKESVLGDTSPYKVNISHDAGFKSALKVTVI
jgi:hypothetical protein